MRERSTWNRDDVMTKAAALNKKADPYTMNQDHPQPAADKYVTGDPSTFAEDVHTPNTWEVEYKGDEVKRDEIGLPDFRPDTFNHAEKTATSREVHVKKAKLCVEVARLMLAGQKTAGTRAIEDQAYALMFMPDEALIATHQRLANEQGEDEDQGDDEGQEKQAQDEKKDEAQGEQKQAQQESKDEKKDEAQGEQKQAQDQDDKGQQEQAKQASPADKTAALVSQVVVALQSGNFKTAQEQIQQLVQQTAQGQQQVMSQEQMQAQIQQMIQQAMGQQVQQVPMAQQQAPQVQSDEQVLDQMLAQDSCGPMAEVDIQMDPAQMDVLAGELGPEDEALRTLFAQDDESQDQGGEQQKQANVRTASTRTVGTRPSAGVAKLGGAASSGSAGPDLSSLWPSAPDVRDVFGM